MKTNIVLFKPEIPQNTANIIRTCVATNSALHLIKPYGFSLDLHQKVFKRSSANYLEKVELYEYDSFEDFITQNETNNLFILTRHGKNVYSDLDIPQALETEDQIYLMFGSESSGVDLEILQKYIKNTFRIPMNPEMRSLNLSNCVAICVYDALRQIDFPQLEKNEVQKKDFL